MAFGAGWLVAITGTGQAIPLESLSELERGFAERMQNVVLTGHYTLKGRERRDDKPERYEITRVAKVGEHRWRFDVHMTYGSVDMTLPVVVPIRWAGDTPIVTITDIGHPRARRYLHGAGHVLRGTVRWQLAARRVRWAHVRHDRAAERLR